MSERANSSWKKIIFISIIINIIKTVFFAVLMSIVLYMSGDLNPSTGSPVHTTCFQNVSSLTSFVLLSIKSQVFMSYQKNKSCIAPQIIFMVQFITCISMVIITFTVVITKVSKKIKSKTIKFRSYATIYRKNGNLYLMFNVDDKKKPKIIETSVKVLLIKDRITRTAENVTSVTFDCQNVEVSVVIEDDKWPIIIQHEIINHLSPFTTIIDMDNQNILQNNFEIFICFQGKNERTGTEIEIKASYISSEIRNCHTCL